MKKNLFLLGTIGAGLLLASCGGEAKNETPEPAEAPTAWSVVETIVNTGDTLNRVVNNYAEDGSVASVETYTYDKVLKLLYKSEHMIYANGKPVFGKSFNEKGAQDGTNIYTYNEDGTLKEQVISVYNEGLARIAPQTKYVYTYDANADVTSVKELKMGIKNWETIYEWEYSYDDQHRLAGRMDYTGEGKERTQSCQYSWTYQEGSNQVKQEDYFVFDLKGGRLKHDSKFVYTYDKNGRVINCLQIRHKRNKKRDDINSRQWTYAYNAAGQLTKNLEEKWNNKDSKWFEVSLTTYEYDADGQMVQNQKLYHTNKGERYLVSEFENAAGHVVAAPASEVEPIKPTLNLDDKKRTSVEEED